MSATVARLHNIKSTELRLGIGRTQVFKLIGSGQLRSVKIGNRRLVPEQAIADFINALDAAAGGMNGPLSHQDRDLLDDLGLADVPERTDADEPQLPSHTERQAT